MGLKHLAATEGAEMVEDVAGVFTPMRIVGFTTALLGVVTVGLYVGRELRVRYKFRRRTPSDFFANAGDPIASAEYGMGV